jgi:WD40 repeat protein
LPTLTPLLVTPALGAPPLRTFSRYYPTHLNAIVSNGTDRAGKRVVMPTGDAMVAFFDADTGEQTGSFSTKALDLDINTHMRGVWLRFRWGVVASERAIVGFDAAKQKQLFVIPTKNKGSVRCVALSPAGDMLFFGTGEGMVRGWDLEKKRVVFNVRAHDDCDRIAISPDGKQLASSGDYEVKIWNIASKQCVAKLGGKAFPLLAAAFSPDGARVFAADWDEGHRVHELAVGKKKPSRTFAGHRARVESLALTSDGETLVSTSYDRTLRIWDLRTGQCRGTFETPAAITTCCVGEDGTLLTCDADGAVSLWDLAAAPKEEPAVLANEVKHLAFEQGTFVASYYGNLVRGGTVAKPSLVALIADAKSDETMPNDPLVALTTDGKTALVARAQGVMEVWDATKAKCTKRVELGRGLAHGGQMFLAITPQGDRSAFLSERHLWVWSLKKGADAGFREERVPTPSSLVLRDQGKSALYIGRDGGVVEVTLDDIDGEAWVGRGAWVGDFPVLVPDGKRVVSRRDKPRVYQGDLLVETLEGKTLAEYTEHAYQVTAVATTSALCASGDADGNVHVWKLENGALVGRWHGPAVITVCVFSTEGRLAVGDATGRVRIYAVG